MRLTLRQIIAFEAIARTGSVTRACEELSSSQSALSASLRDLESVLGANLFDRRGKRLVLNDAGRRLQPRATSLLRQLREFESASADSTLKGSLVVGGSTTIGTYLLPEVCGAFIEAHPEVRLELIVGRDGHVRDVKTLRATVPFTDAVQTAVRGWTFTPAEERDPAAGPTPVPVESKVLVVALFRPPALTGPTLGEPSSDVGAASPDVPAPSAVTMPLFPPNAVNDGVVLTELTVAADGRVASARTVRSAAGFDEAALDALRPTMFRPAQVRGQAAERFVYVVTAFRQPITSARRR